MKSIRMCLLNMMNWITSSFNKTSYSKFVLRKQLHMCQPKRCYKTSKHCKYGFPYEINFNSHAKVNKNTNKWEYFWLKCYCLSSQFTFDTRCPFEYSNNNILLLVILSIEIHHENWTTWHIEYKHYKCQINKMYKKCI
jgi:hypothetical protein